jgi:hypothetical protein
MKTIVEVQDIPIPEVQASKVRLSEQQITIQKWPSIELLHNLYRHFQILEVAPQIQYRAKIKLDGTNAGIQIFPNGTVVAQSRTKIITPQDDNSGFAKWVYQNLDFFAQLADTKPFTIFGEWCGKGIQSRTAISQIDRKIFTVFAIQTQETSDSEARFEVDPETISDRLPAHPDIYVLPFQGAVITLDFGDKEQLEGAIADLNQWIEVVEQVDPWVNETFGIAGLGEGLVFYPLAETQVKSLTYGDLLFKAKGEKHQTVKAKKPVQATPEIAAGVDEFVSLVVTPSRLEQGLTEACNGQAVMSQIGAFLQWFATDVQKESVAELEAAQLTWKDVNKAVTTAAKDWYQARSKSLL